VKQQAQYYDVSTNQPQILLKCVKRGFDLSNAYTISVAKSPAYSGPVTTNTVTGYTLTNYLNAINTGIASASINNELNATYSQAVIDSSGYFNLPIDITKKITQINYVLNLSGGASLGTSGNSFGIFTPNGSQNIGLLSEFGNYSIYQGSRRLTSTTSNNLSLTGTQNVFDISFQFLSSYSFTNAFLVSISGVGGTSSVSNSITYNVPTPTGVYSLQGLTVAINNAFTYFVDSDNYNVFAGTTFVTQPPVNNVVSATLTLVINKYLTQNDYSIQFVDSGINGYSKISWYNYLHIDPSMVDTSFTLINTPIQRTVNTNVTTSYIIPLSYSLGNGSYIGVRGFQTLLQNTITLNSTNNYFTIIPFQDGVSCSYTNDPTLQNYNNIQISIPITDKTGNIVQYTRDNLITAINNAFSGTIASGSTISIETINGVEYTKIRLTVNKIYSAKDYRLVFYDPYSFVKCFVGAPNVQNTTWDSTLGWILGYRAAIEYDLSQYGSGLNPIQIVGDTTVSTNLFNYFLICLDDYNQNHLNDGLVTVTPRDTSVPLPSYANRSNFNCNPVTGQLSYNQTAVTEYNKLTQSQLYSITEIANSSNTSTNALSKSVSTKSYSHGPYVQDVFAIIPLRLAGLANGAYYVDNGGSLQNQQRLYFGPINLYKMSVKLVDDRGNVVNLNNSNWSFSILCDLLYKPNPST
jgi:hypothetical protein